VGIVGVFILIGWNLLSICIEDYANPGGCIPAWACL